jgi:hypothetical protein
MQIYMLLKKDRSTFLPSPFHGGRRNLKMPASNALAIVSELERPTLFITLTGNPNWPEVQSQLLPGQTAFDINTEDYHMRILS